MKMSIVKKTDEMADFFKQQGYPDCVLKVAKTKATRIPRNQALAKSARLPRQDVLPLVSTYHPRAKQIFRVLTSLWNTLQEDQKTCSLNTHL